MYLVIDYTRNAEGDVQDVIVSSGFFLQSVKQRPVDYTATNGCYLVVHVHILN